MVCRVCADLYTIEFQKSGLPHCHTLLWVTSPYKISVPEQVDQLISAEIPHPEDEPRLYNIVSKLMIHRPCGLANTGSHAWLMEHVPNISQKNMKRLHDLIRMVIFIIAEKMMGVLL